ncbi:hypothetical protein THAOC_03907, partial [Thalassiosira oceanica]
QLKEGLQVIGGSAFRNCKALRDVTLPSSVIELRGRAFDYCSSLVNLQLNEGLQVIGSDAHLNCFTASRSVTIPSSVTTLGKGAFLRCMNLSEVIFLSGKTLLDQEFFSRGIFSEDQGILNQGAIKEMLFDDDTSFVFNGCPLINVKISIGWALSERMARLPKECMRSVEERIHNLHHLELLQDGDVLACFPVVRTANAHDGAYQVQDTNLETSRSLYRELQFIAFYELKETSILIELAFWKSIIDKGGDRACPVAIPGPAKSLLMEYCGFAGFLRPAF